MGNKYVSGSHCQSRKPPQKFVSIGMGRKTMYLSYSGSDRMLLAQNSYLRGTTNNLSSQRSHCLIADKEYGALRTGDISDEMMLYSTASTHTRASYYHNIANNVLK